MPVRGRSRNTRFMSEIHAKKYRERERIPMKPGTGQWLLLAAVLFVLAAIVSNPLEAFSPSPEVCPPMIIADPNKPGLVSNSDTNGLATHPRIATEKLSDGNTAVYLVWEEDRIIRNAEGKEISRNREIWLKRVVFKSPCEVDTEKTKMYDAFPVSGTPTSGVSSAPDLALTGRGTGLIVWQDSVQGPENQWDIPMVYLKRFAFTAGKDGKPILKLDDLLNISEVSWAAENPSVVADRSGGIYVAWVQATRDRGTEIFFRSSAPFAPKVDVSRSLTGIAGSPRLAMDAAKMYVVWQGTSDPATGTESEEIFISQAGNAGGSFFRPAFSLPWNISGPFSPGKSVEPTIAIEKNAQVVVWSDNSLQSDSEIFLRRSTEGFFPPFNVSGNCEPKNVGHSSQPTATESGGDILVAWRESKGISDTDIYFARSNFRPEDPFPCVNVSAPQPAQPNQPKQSPGLSRLPALVADSSGNAYIAWEEEVSAGTTEIHLAVVKK
jgi:hypothetical protein